MSETPKPPVKIRPIFMALLTLAFGVVIVAYALPSLSGGGPSKTIKIVGNLRQIELVKQMWAADHSVTGLARVSEQDLFPYFPGRRETNGLVASIVGERYVINAEGMAPEARLTRALGKWPKGTTIRLRDNRPPLYEVVLPNQPVQRTGASRSAHETNEMPGAAGSRR